MSFPNEVNRLLRLIRALDKKVENMQSDLSLEQKRFEQKTKELKDKKVTDVPSGMKI